MRAIAIQEFGGRDKLKLMDLPVPVPKENEILIKINAAGVNPVDWKIREGLLKGRIPHEFPVVMGWDAAGTVEKKGRQVERFAPGDEVYAYCRKDMVKDGTYAEFIAVPEENAALKPKRLSFKEAATVPLSALTAYQSLYDAAGLKKGETVLIHAAAGGVGGFAVQLAKHTGAYVLGTASSKNHEFIRRLGCDQPIDYEAEDFATAVRKTCPDGVDVVFDCVGGETIDRSRDILKEEGRVVSIVTPDGVERLKNKGVNAQFVFVAPDSKQLSLIGDMIEEGKLNTNISAESPLEEAAIAHELSESHHIRGKIVLTI